MKFGSAGGRGNLLKPAPKKRTTTKPPKGATVGERPRAAPERPARFKPNRPAPSLPVYAPDSVSPIKRKAF